MRDDLRVGRGGSVRAVVGGEGATVGLVGEGGGPPGKGNSSVVAECLSVGGGRVGVGGWIGFSVALIEVTPSGPFVAVVARQLGL
jgi:hypothetical protein